MSEQQDIVLPSESVSNAPPIRKSRPGKAQRAAKKAAGVPSQASAQTGATSVSNASAFARKMSFIPTPQPGKFPVVFPTGAGEPTRDAYMAIDGTSLANCFGDLHDEYLGSARYAEFSQNAGIEDEVFARDVASSSVLGVCQQIVHAHLNMGLPMGDFSSISSTEVFNPVAIRAIVHQFGEFSVENLGTRYLYKAYDHEVTALVRTAKRIAASDVPDIINAFKEHWLPTSVNDPRTGFILSAKLAKRLLEFGVSMDVTALCAAMFHQPSTAFDVVKGVLPPGERTLYDPLFGPYADRAAFAALFAGQNGRDILTNLSLDWGGRAAADLNFNLSPKVEFPDLMRPWLLKKTTLMKFFSCGTGAAQKAVASGAASQLSEVFTREGITVVKSRVAVPSHEFSLLSCFPASALVEDLGEMRVVLTTSISTAVRATEFIQLDWT
jgi:hypothetical protein